MNEIRLKSFDYSEYFIAGKNINKEFVKKLNKEFANTIDEDEKIKIMNEILDLKVRC